MKSKTNLEHEVINVNKNKGHPKEKKEVKVCGAKKQNGELCKNNRVLPNGRCKHHGGYAGAPKGNKNAMTHGAFLKTIFSNLTQEELEMVDNSDKDPLAELEYELSIATVREKRMIDRLCKLKEDEFTVTHIEDTVTQNGNRQSAEKKTVRENNVTLIGKLEEHITRVQNVKSKLIAQKAAILNSRNNDVNVDITKIVDAITTTSQQVWTDDDEEE